MIHLKIKPTLNQVTLDDFRKVSEFQKISSSFFKSLEEINPLMSRLLIEIDNFDKDCKDED